MRTQLKFKALPALPEGQRLQALAKGVQFELMKFHIVADYFGARLAQMRKAANDTHGVSIIGRDAQLTVPDLKEFEAAVAAKYATPDQNPILTTAAQSVQAWFHSNMPETDVGYMALFDLVDLRGTGQDTFQINTTAAGITWVERKPGARTAVRREFSEASTPVKFVEYSAGLGILDQWLQFNQFWNVDEAIAEFRANALDKRASVHYGLFTALSSGIDQAFATDDATTFNNAAAAILRNLRGLGMAVGANAQFDIVCAPESVGRVLAMLDAKRGSPMIAFGTQNEPIAFSVRNIIVTTHVPAATNGYYLVLPGRKIKRGEWKDLTLESARDITASATDWVGVEQYNAAVGETAQVRRVLFS